MRDTMPPRLEQWRVVHVDGVPHLIGIVHGHPDLRNGARAVTSRLLWLAPDRTAARTESRLYALGAEAIGPLPEDWARALDAFLARAWGKRRIEPD
jgi:hypothetical protein